MSDCYVNTIFALISEHQGFWNTRAAVACDLRANCNALQGTLQGLRIRQIAEHNGIPAATLIPKCAARKA